MLNGSSTRLADRILSEEGSFKDGQREEDKVSYTAAKKPTEKGDHGAAAGAHWEYNRENY